MASARLVASVLRAGRASFLNQISAVEHFRHLELARGVGAVRLGPGAFLGARAAAERNRPPVRGNSGRLARVRHGNQSRRGQSFQRLVAWRGPLLRVARARADRFGRTEKVAVQLIQTFPPLRRVASTTT